MTHPFEGYADHYDQEVRLIILRALNDDPDGTMSERRLLIVFEQFGIMKGRDYLRTQLRWLESDARAVILREPGTSMIATLSEQGEAHVTRRAVIEGIMRPSRPRA